MNFNLYSKSTAGNAEFRKKPHSADSAYREAVGRLRIFLAESYTPLKKSARDFDSGGEDTDNQSLISCISRVSKKTPDAYKYYSSLSKPSRAVPKSDIQLTPRWDQNYPPTELMTFIEKQEMYIEQLERESRFCRDELSALLNKVKDLVAENENLHAKQKNNIMKSVLHHLETETETETDFDQFSSGMAKKPTKNLEGPAIVFESRISELEAQLTQTKIDLKKALDENTNLVKNMSEGNILETGSFEQYRKQITSLQREKDALQDTVNKLQDNMHKIRSKEQDTSDQVKKSLSAVEQAQYEKNSAEIEIRRLKDELDRQHLKLREALSDQNRRISDERTAVERRYTQQIEQLTAELGVQWETTNKLQLEMDKYRRENGDLRRELAQKQALLDDIRKDMQNKMMGLQSEIGVNAAEKSALEQQIATLQMTNERSDRQSKQETSRLQAEMVSLRQRLDRADADLIHSRRENIRLNEQVASLEKEIKVNTALNEEKNKISSSVEPLALPAPSDQSKQNASYLQDLESKHAATVAELEEMIHSQNQLMDKLSNDCHTLTQKLEDANARHKEEIRELQSSLNSIKSTLISQASSLANTVKGNEHQTNQQTINPNNITSAKATERVNNVYNAPNESTDNDNYKAGSTQNTNSGEQQQLSTSPVTSETHNYPSEQNYYATDPNNGGLSGDPSSYMNQYDPNQQYTLEDYQNDPNQQYQNYDYNESDYNQGYQVEGNYTDNQQLEDSAYGQAYDGNTADPSPTTQQ